MPWYEREIYLPLMPWCRNHDTEKRSLGKFKRGTPPAFRTDPAGDADGQFGGYVLPSQTNLKLEKGFVVSCRFLGKKPFACGGSF